MHTMLLLVHTRDALHIHMLHMHPLDVHTRSCMPSRHLRITRSSSLSAPVASLLGGYAVHKLVLLVTRISSYAYIRVSTYYM